MQAKQLEMIDWLQQRRDLWWDVEDLAQLSEMSILERVLQYGQWQDFLDLQKKWGLGKMKSLFEQLLSKKRKNLRPQTQKLFIRYFAKYA